MCHAARANNETNCNVKCLDKHSSQSNGQLTWHVLPIQIPPKIIEEFPISRNPIGNFPWFVVRRCMIRPDELLRLKSYRDVRVWVCHTRPCWKLSIMRESPAYDLTETESFESERQKKSDRRWWICQSHVSYLICNTCNAGVKFIRVNFKSNIRKSVQHSSERWTASWRLNVLLRQTSGIKCDTFGLAALWQTIYARWPPWSPVKLRTISVQGDSTRQRYQNSYLLKRHHSTRHPACRIRAFSLSNEIPINPIHQLWILTKDKENTFHRWRCWFLIEFESKPPENYFHLI